MFKSDVNKVLFCSVNPYHAEFLKLNNPPSIYGTIHFKGYQDENLKLVSQEYRASMDVQAGLALYWWERLVTFGVGRISVNNSVSFKFPHHILLNYDVLLGVICSNANHHK